MVTPLQLDSYTRDQWQEFDALAIAQIAPLAYDDCYRPKIYVGLDSGSQNVLQSAYASFGMHIQPGSLVYGFGMGSQYGSTPQWSVQVSDEATGIPFFSDPVSQAFLSNSKGQNYPYLLRAPRPVVGDGLFLVEVWNQQPNSQWIVPLFFVLEVR